MSQHIAHIAIVVRDGTACTERGITFVRPPKNQAYGTVAAFSDLHGNLWDLIEFA